MRTLWKYLLLIGLFFIDVCVIGIVGFSFLQSVLCYAIVTFLYHSLCPLFYSAFLLLGFESFIVSDLFGLNYLYLIPLFTLLKTTTHYLTSKEITALIILITAIGCQAAFLVYFKLNHQGFSGYTLYQIGANLLVLFVSLKWFSTVEQGNRF
jgi:hypothetical protein